MKVTWKQSTRIHRTIDKKHTICGHSLKNYAPQITSKKRKCITCFKVKADHKEEWCYVFSS